MLGIFIEKTEMYRVSGLVTKVQKKMKEKKDAKSPRESFLQVP